jgi:hypothetical protein
MKTEIVVNGRKFNLTVSPFVRDKNYQTYRREVSGNTQINESVVEQTIAFLSNLNLDIPNKIKNIEATYNAFSFEQTICLSWSGIKKDLNFILKKNT